MLSNFAQKSLIQQVISITLNLMVSVFLAMVSVPWVLAEDYGDDCETLLNLSTERLSIQQWSGWLKDETGLLGDIATEVDFLVAAHNARQTPYAGSIAESINRLNELSQRAAVRADRWGMQVRYALAVLEDVNSPLVVIKGLGSAGKVQVEVQIQTSNEPQRSILEVDLPSVSGSWSRGSAIGYLIENLRKSKAEAEIANAALSVLQVNIESFMKGNYSNLAAFSQIKNSVLLLQQQFFTASTSQRRSTVEHLEQAPLMAIARELDSLGAQLANRLSQGPLGPSNIIGWATRIHQVTSQNMNLLQAEVLHEEGFNYFNLKELSEHILKRSRILMAERDPRYLEAGILGLSELLKQPLRLPLYSKPVFGMSWNRLFLKIFYKQWAQRHGSVSFPLHHISAAQTNLIYNQIQQTQQDGHFRFAFNGVLGLGQVFVKIPYADGARVEIFRPGDGLEATLGDGQPYQITSILEPRQGHSFIMVRTCEDVEGTLTLRTRSLSPQEWVNRGLRRSNAAVSDLQDYAQPGIVQVETPDLLN